MVGAAKKFAIRTGGGGGGRGEYTKSMLKNANKYTIKRA